MESRILSLYNSQLFHLSNPPQQALQTGLHLLAHPSRQDINGERVEGGDVTIKVLLREVCITLEYVHYDWCPLLDVAVLGIGVEVNETMEDVDAKSK